MLQSPQAEPSGRVPPAAPLTDGQDPAFPDQIAAVLEKALDGEFAWTPPDKSRLSRAIDALLKKMQQDEHAQLDRMVDLSVHVNETAINSSNILTYSKDISSNVENISAAAEQLSTSISQIDTTASQARERVSDVLESAHKGQESAIRAVHSMEDIARSIASASTQVDSLTSASEQIGDIIESIDRISKQTNLLALNATIEAARAGEAGKGFSVVASEVKILSGQTAKATDDIRNRIEFLQNKMSEIVMLIKQSVEVIGHGKNAIASVGEDMQLIGTKIQGVDSNFAEVSGILTQQTEAAREVSKGIVSVSDLAARNRQQVDKTARSMDRSIEVIERELTRLAESNIPLKVLYLAKADHTAWKRRLSDMIAGRSTLDPDELSSHHMCRLGKWYDSDQAAPLRSSALFQEMEKPHEAVHANGIAAAQAYHQGGAAPALSYIERVEEASDDVMRLLNALIAQNITAR